jgi:gluconokinase
VAGRSGHFMPATLVSSQYAALEPLGTDERGLTVSLELAVEEIVERFLRWLASERSSRAAAPP